MKKSDSSSTHSRVAWPDALRVVSAFAVVWLHVSAAYQKGTTPFELYPMTACICRLMAAFAVPVFFMLSGMFFLDPNRPVPMKKLFRSSSRLVKAFFFWSAVYLIILPNRPSFPPSSRDIVRFFHGAAPLWFLPAILSCYFFTPPLRAVAKERTVEWWAIGAALLFVLLPSSLRPLSRYFSNSLPNHQSIGVISFPIFYFLLGDFLNREELSRRQRVGIYGFGFLGFIAMISVRCLAWIRGGDRLHEGAMPEQLWAALLAASVFVFFKYCLGKKLSKNTPSWLCTLSGATFGVYLIHELFMFAIRFAFHLSGIKAPFGHFPPVAILVESTIVFLCSIVTTILMKKTPVFRSVV